MAKYRTTTRIKLSIILLCGTQESLPRVFQRLA